MREQAGHEVLALALPDQVDVLDLVVAGLGNNFTCQLLKVCYNHT